MSSTMKIALYGDSYISRLGYFCDFDLKVPGNVKFFGKGGMTVARQDPTILHKLLTFQPEVVFICIGGNDITSTSKPADIVQNIELLVDNLKENGVRSVYVTQICERGLFIKDPNLHKKSFNAQSKKINVLLGRNQELKLVNVNMKFPKDYDEDKVHFSYPAGITKFFHCVRRVMFQHKRE